MALLHIIWPSHTESLKKWMMPRSIISIYLIITRAQKRQTQQQTMWMHNKLNIFYKRCQDRVVLAFFAAIYPDKLPVAGFMDAKGCKRRLK